LFIVNCLINDTLELDNFLHGDVLNFFFRGSIRFFLKRKIEIFIYFKGVRMKGHGFLVFVFLIMCAIWGAEFLLVAKALDHFPAASIMMLPQLFSCPILLGISAFRNYRKNLRKPQYKKGCLRILPKSAMIQLAILAFIFHGIGDVGFAIAEKEVSSSVVAALYCLEPVAASLYAYFKKLKHGNLDSLEWFGLLLSIIGVLALVFPEMTDAKVQIEGKASGIQMAFYILAAIISVCAYGVGTAISQRILEYHNIHESDATLYANFFGAIFIFIETFLIDFVMGNSIGESLSGIFNAKLIGWVYILAYTISSSVICTMMFMWLLKRIGAKTALNTILVRLFALLFGIVFNGEWDGYSWWDAKIQIMGAAISLFGLLCMLRRELESEEDFDSSSSYDYERVSMDAVELHG
jgi:drug/metabolite transporter (DMT)-like permease